MNFFPLWCWSFFNFKMKKKKSPKQFQTLIFFVHYNLRLTTVSLQSLNCFLSSERFMKQTLELKVDLWEFAFLQQKQVRFEKMAFHISSLSRVIRSKFWWVICFLMQNHHFFNNKHHSWLGLCNCQRVSKYLNTLACKCMQCIWMLQM